MRPADTLPEHLVAPGVKVSMKTFKLKNNRGLFPSLLMCLLLGSCASMPEGAKPVNNFETEKYLGTWYEIARMDFRFEKGLSKVTATYSKRADGKIRVDNKGYDAANQKWKQSIGKARLTGAANMGTLEVSFFGPFYAAYNVLAVDEHYQYALVVGGSVDYVWILSRTKTIPEEVRQHYLEIARGLGCDVNALVWTEQ